MWILRLAVFLLVFSNAAGAATSTSEICPPAPSATASDAGTTVAAACIKGDCCGKQGCWTSCDCW